MAERAPAEPIPEVPCAQGDLRRLLLAIGPPPDADQFMFVAICGFEDGENLFLDGDSWSVPYIPANVRRQPFNVIGTEGTNDNGEAMQVPALSIDLDSPRISATEGEKLFDSEGEPTTYLAEMSNMMMGVVNSTQRGRQLAQRLNELGLIKGLALEFETVDGQKRNVGGLHTLSEEKFNELPQDTVLDMHSQGQLSSLYAMMASWGQIGGLVERKNARLRAASETA